MPGSHSNAGPQSPARDAERQTRIPKASHTMAPPGFASETSPAPIGGLAAPFRPAIPLAAMWRTTDFEL